MDSSVLFYIEVYAVLLFSFLKIHEIAKEFQAKVAKTCSS